MHTIDPNLSPWKVIFCPVATTSNISLCCIRGISKENQVSFSRNTSYALVTVQKASLALTLLTLSAEDDGRNAREKCQATRTIDVSLACVENCIALSFFFFFGLTT